MSGGRLSARYVRRYGVRLMPRLYKHLDPVPAAEAEAAERELAERLRESGYGVWQR